MQRIRIKFTKEDPLKFVGHLDFIKVYEKAIRRTDLPIAYSHGFNPRMQISWGPPLSLGITSDCELADLYFEDWTRPERVKEELNKVLPPGSRVTEAGLCHPSTDSVAASIVASEYTFELSESMDLTEKIKEILKQETIIINRTSKGKDKEIDARKMIYKLETEGNKLKAVIQTSNNGSLKTSELLDLLGNPPVAHVKKTQLLSSLKKIST